MKRWIMAFALLLTWTPVAAMADDTELAREHFERGVALLDDSQFARALIELERSLAIRPTAPVLFNLGLAYRGVGRYQDAIKHFRRFLDVRHETKHREMANLATTLIQELEAALVHVEVQVTGDATTVRVDDRSVARGDGVHRVVLDPGSHVFEANRDGYVPARATVLLKAGARERIVLDAGETPKPSHVTVETRPAGAEIWLDGKLVARGRYEGRVTSGTRRLRVAASGYESEERSLRVGPGSRQQVSITLTEASRPVTKEWWFWAGSAAVAGATVLTVILLQPEEESPHAGSLGFVTEALR